MGNTIDYDKPILGSVSAQVPGSTLACGKHVRASHMVSSMMALTMSPSLWARALIALLRDTLAWLITSSIS